MTEVNHAVAPDPLSRACLKCGKPFQVKFPSERKRYCSYSCSVKARPPRTGAANANWRGGKTAHPLYDTYLDMIGRCYRPTHQRYADYGGRGITVCERWRDDFWAFVADMGERPEGLTLDRADNDKGYGPDNCRWATDVEQCHNRRPQRLRPCCPNKHEYTPENTRINAKGYQECITCADATRERQNKKSAECKRKKRAEMREAKAA